MAAPQRECGGVKGVQGPLPFIVHGSLECGSVPDDGRIIVVGDVHGCHEEFAAVLRACGRTDRDVVILVGDLVNKGPDSRAVVRLARAIGALAVRGNHDDKALGIAAGGSAGDADDSWLRRKPKQWRNTKWLADMSSSDIEWLYAMPFSIRIPTHNCVVVHGGMVPNVPRRQQCLAHLLNLRFIRPRSLALAADMGTRTFALNGAYSSSSESGSESGEESNYWSSSSSSDSESEGVARRRLLQRIFSETSGDEGEAASAKLGYRTTSTLTTPPPPLPREGAAWGWEACRSDDAGAELWATQWEGPDHVIFGHDAMRGLQRTPWATGLDTGCVYGGRLSACVLPSMAQVRLARERAADGIAAVRGDRAWNGALANNAWDLESMCRIVSVPAQQQYALPKTKRKA